MPPLRRFILAGGAPAGAALHVARTVCRRAERAMVAARRGSVRARAAALRQSPVGSALRHGARRQPSRRHRGNRVVSASAAATSPLSSVVPTTPARSWRGRTTRTFPWHRCCCRRACGRHIAAVYAFARRADDFADEPGYSQPTSASGFSTTGSGGSMRPRPARSAPAAPNDLIFVAVARCDPRARPAGLALLGSAERVPAGCDDQPLRDAGKTCSTTAALGEPGRPAGPAHRRLPGRGARSIVGRAVHGAAADQLLAGLRARLAERAALRAAR